MRVVVIGAGVIGAAVARGLALRGAEVVVLESGAGASPASFGWINASFYADAAHHALRSEGIAAYERLMADGDWPVQFGCALWWEAQGQGLAEMDRDLRALGYPVQRLSRAEIAAREPDLAFPPEEALGFPREGWAEVASLAERLLNEACSNGARVLRGMSVDQVIEQSGRVTGVRCGADEIAADHVVVTAGCGAPHILASVGGKLPMLRRPGAIVTTARVEARLGSVLVTPEGEVRQLPDGRLLSPAMAKHQGDTAEEITEPLERIGDRTAARMGRLVGQPDLAWEQVQVAYRPVPQDGLPVLGPVGPDGLHVAVMHSGVTLAAIAAEITVSGLYGDMNNALRSLAAPYTPARFQ